MPTPRKPQQRKAAFKSNDIPIANESDRRIPLIVLAVIAALMLIVLVFTQCTKSSDNMPAPGEPAPVEESQDSSEAITPPENPSAKTALNDYTWEELSQISSKIADAATSDEVSYVAKQYNLVDADGKLDPFATKVVELTDGTSLHVRIVGFNADSKSDGSGPAGLTFMFTEPVATAAYNVSGNTDGGWPLSDLSGYLGGEFWQLLPEDLTVQISEVTKRSAMPGEEEGTSESGDIMWLPSYAEVLGGGSGALGQEGTQYQLFRDDAASASASSGGEGAAGGSGDAEDSPSSGVQDKVNQHIPVSVISSGGQAGSWWLRSVDTASESSVYVVDANGASTTHSADTQNMVVPFFSV